MVIPYLSFCGNCEEVLNDYISIFGGEIKMLSRYTYETGAQSSPEKSCTRKPLSETAL